MERHFSTGVATIVQLMAANRAASARADVQFGAGEEIYFDANAEADLLAEHAIPRDVVGDWLLHLARAQRDEWPIRFFQPRLLKDTKGDPRRERVRN